MLRIRWGLLGGALVFLATCSCVVTPRPDGSFTLLAWNVENLFDDVADGGEYPEFVPGQNWDTTAFFDRCQRIADLLRSLPDGGADLVAFEEVENENVVRVLRDRFLDGLGYRYLAVPPDDGSNVRVALLSRFPFVHTGVFQPASEVSSEPLRTVLEAEFNTGAGNVVVLVNHWKSRLPTPESTENERRAAAEVVSRRLAAYEAEENFPIVLAVGDFNADLKLSAQLDQACLRKAVSSGGSDGVSPWLDVWDDKDKAVRAGRGWYDAWEPVPGAPGTYFFDGDWSRLDHAFLASASLRSRSVSIIGSPFLTASLLNSNGQPRAWSPKDRKGVSDHLPLWIRVTL